MKNLLFILLFLQSANSLALAKSDHPEVMTSSEELEVLWGEYLMEDLDPVKFFTMIEQASFQSLSARDLLRVQQIENDFSGNRKTVVYHDELSLSEALRLASEEEFYSNVQMKFSDNALEQLKEAREQLHWLKTFRAKSRDEVIDLVFESPALSTYQNSQYAGGIKLFLFCRHDRSWPCRLVLKDVFDNLVRDEHGQLWTMPALGKSAANLPYYITNGHTPSGIHSIDSVMPLADQQVSYGKFRRLILNWIADDASVRELLPNSAKNKKWWKQASLARDNGRKWLRIHGTGRVNSNRDSTYYPHTPTEGCVSVREGEYEDTLFEDQRLLLDEMMKAMEMAPVLVNEPQIKGMLYVIELDDEKEKVTKETLKKYGVH